MKFHPPTQESTVLAVEECVAPDGDFPTYPYLASADFAAGRMTRRSLGCCAPNHISADWRSRVWLLGTTGLPVGLHFGKKEMLPIAAPKEIKDGKMTDVYFVRTMQVLKAKK
jgi:hypothetical protein